MKTVEQFEAQFTALAELRKPFPSNQISKLNRGKGVELDYVGHAALTSRLLDVDPLWTWEPIALTPDGLPLFDDIGGLWIKLTVSGMTRLGYGHAGAKKGGDAIKEVIGDALRNAAMRFGAALDLWHKGDLYAHEQDDDIERDAIQNEGKPAAPAPGAQARFSELVAMFRKATSENDVKEVEAMAKAEWDDLKALPGAREGIAGARNAALQRIAK